MPFDSPQTFDYEVKKMTACQKDQFISESLNQEYAPIVEGTLEVKLGYFGYYAEAKAYFVDAYGDVTNEVCDVHFEAARCHECRSITWTWGEGGECVDCPDCDNSDTY